MFKEKDRSNAILRYLISVSQGYGFKAPARIRFSVLLRLKRDLEDMGALWQLKRADNWIHRFQQTYKNNLQTEGLIFLKKKKNHKHVGVL